jgi:tetratricopeptide (TPR) repeat protein
LRRRWLERRRAVDRETLRRLGEALARDSLRVDAERAGVPELARRLAAVAPHRQARAVVQDPSFHCFSFGGFLVDQARRLAERDLGEARRHAALAVAVGERLDAVEYGEALVFDLRARAWAAVAAVIMAACELALAADALVRSEALLERASGDDLELARVLELKAALRREQQRYREAHGLIDDAIALYQRYRDPEGIGSGLLAKAEIHVAQGELEAAVRALRRGLSLAEPESEGERWLSARCCLVGCLAELGRTEQAWFLLEALRPQLPADFSPVLLQFAWAEGKLYRAQGRTEQAERSLLVARNGFVEAERLASAVAVCLDLAGLYAERGQIGEMRQVARAILPLAKSRALPRQALAATIVLEQAGRVESISSELLAVFDRRPGRRAGRAYQLALMTPGR